MGYCKSPEITEIDLHQAVNKILADKPDHIKDDNFINNMYSDMKTTDTLKAILLTDVHIDLDYKEGMNVDCGDVLCCRSENGPPGPGQEASGEWGAGTCDPPVKTVNAVLDQIVALSPDIVFWTGDNSPHDIWDMTEDDVTNLTIKTTQMIKEKFEGTNITVVPT
jgi:sphingomyelin phosphodiesterase